MAQNGVPAAAYIAYTILLEDGAGVYIAYNPYEGPVPATLPDPPAGSACHTFTPKFLPRIIKTIVGTSKSSVDGHMLLSKLCLVNYKYSVLLCIEDT